MDSDVIPRYCRARPLVGDEPRPIHRQIAFANLFAREFIYPSLAFAQLPNQFIFIIIITPIPPPLFFRFRTNKRECLKK